MAITSAAYFIVITSLSNVIPNVSSIEQYIPITQYIIISIIIAFLFALNQIILTFHQYEKNPREILKNSNNNLLNYFTSNIIIFDYF